MSNETDNRLVFNGADWYTLAQHTFTTLIGAGGIGSWTAFFLNKLGVNLTVYDDDIFEERNMGGQLVSKNMIGVYKTDATKYLALQTSKNKEDYNTISGNNTCRNRWTVQGNKEHLINWDIYKPNSVYDSEVEPFQYGSKVRYCPKLYNLFSMDPVATYSYPKGIFSANIFNNIVFPAAGELPIYRISLNTLPYIIVLGPDSMIPRREVFEVIDYYHENLLKTNSEADIFTPFVVIDGRLTAEQYQIYTYHSHSKKSLDKYADTLFSDDAIPPLPCNFRQTSHIAAAIGSTITEIITNLLANIQFYLYEEEVRTPAEYVNMAYVEGPRIVPIEVISESPILMKDYKLITDV